ncbi:MAG: hypothetical protein KA758_16020 [Acidimicrobiales bacterium]|nr:hypothetical protein [Acidimicrobiales bacterium]
MTTFVDGAATFAPVSAPLRDWLREHDDLAAHVGTDTNGTVQVYAGGFPDAVDLTNGPAVSLYTAGGLDGGTLHDRPFVRFDVVALTAPTAEATAYALRSVLAHAAGAALGPGADPSDVWLTGADTAAPLWAPDPDTNRPRFVVTSTLTVQAVGI